MIATLHPVLWIVFWIFAPGFTLCALALICYAVFGPPTGVELEEKRQQSFLDRMDAAAKEKPSPPASVFWTIADRPDGGRIVAWGRTPGEAVQDLVNRGYPVDYGALVALTETSWHETRKGDPGNWHALETSPPASGCELALQGGQEPIRKDGSPDAGETVCPRCDGHRWQLGRNRIEDCQVCNGTGVVPVCTTCGGLGTVDETVRGHFHGDLEAPCPDCKP